MHNYQEVLKFFAAKLVHDSTFDYRMDGGNESKFTLILSAPDGRRTSVAVELGRDSVRLGFPRELAAEADVREWLDDLEFRLEQSRGRNVHVQLAAEADDWTIAIEA